jgi:excisionase family DNA binding protein
MFFLQLVLCSVYYVADMAPWLDLDDLEDYLKIPKSTLYRLARQGRLPGHKIGRAWRFQQNEVDEWIKAGRQHVQNTGRGEKKS